jgi:hypothetical protein
MQRKSNLEQLGESWKVEIDTSTNRREEYSEAIQILPG